MSSNASPQPQPAYPDPTGGASFIIAWRAKRQSILVVGGGPVAAGRVFNSLEADADVTVVAPHLCPELQYRARACQISWHARKFIPSDLDGVAIVLTAIDDCEESVRIAQLCRERRIPINAADMNDLCDFWFMSMHRDKSVQVAVSTNAKAPKLANRIRRHIAGGLPRGTGDAVEKIGMLRQMIRQMDPEPESSKRRMAWLSQLCEYWPMEQLAKLDQEDYQKLLDAYMENTDPRCVSIGDKADYPAKVAAPITLTAVTVATDAAVSLTDSGCEETLPSTPESASTKEGGGISQNASASSSITTFSTANTNNHTGNNGLGSITLVGAGLGDPDLLTVKAKRALTTADYVISDKLIPSPILELVPESAELYIARKFPGMANAAQHDIINRALEQLRQGKRVVRLKQGDPFVYGRGGEEVLEFRQHGYEPEVVPGLSSALSGPALCGIPVTHRGVADQVLLMSGSNRQGELPQIPPYLSTRTLVILMSVKRLAVLVELLTKQHHYPADLPVAMVERAGCTDQRMVKGTLETIIEIVERVGANPPGLIVVGHAINVLYGTDASQEEGSGIVQDRYRQTSLLGFYAGESAASALSY